MLFLAFGVLFIQSSSLISRLLNLLIGGLLILSITKPIYFSRVYLYIYILVYIGGLLVLLVRLSSIVSIQEQTITPSFRFLISTLVLILPMLDELLVSSSFRSFLRSLMWAQHFLVVYGLFFVLIVSCLTLTSNLVFEFKGMVRSL